ncbi:MAG: orotidine-5'-phosphate decarboxylase [bacterium]|nr:orotidine-5'-phosphate decarboxylase [bacterium]
MSERNFFELLEARWAEGKHVCVGLDSELSKIPTCAVINGVTNTIFNFNRRIVDATYDVVCAYKPNIAFYEELGPSGLEALWKTFRYINDIAPGVPVVLDHKCTDIGNTNLGYVKSSFTYFAADAVTVFPYFGKEALKPFLAQKNKGIIVLCRTSNPGGGEFQDLLVDGIPFYQVVARHVAETWNEHGNCCVVAGATFPKELAEIRKIVGDMTMLLPGIGAQQGDVKATVTAGKNSRGKGMIINNARGVIFASDGPDFAEAARTALVKCHNLVIQSL